jgi:hypothetical protein
MLHDADATTVLAISVIPLPHMEDGESGKALTTSLTNIVVSGSVACHSDVAATSAKRESSLR